MNRYGNNTDTDWLMAGSPGGMFASSIRQESINADLAALTTQVMTSVAVPVQSGDVVTSVTFKSGATAAGTPTNWWFAVYSAAGTPALLGQTADQTTTAWAANTAMTLALATPVLVQASGVLYVSVMVKATTVPTLLGANLSLAGASAGIAGSKVRAQTSGSGLTTTAPATIATPTTVATVPYAVLT
jgi:hypothetical protein